MEGVLPPSRLSGVRCYVTWPRGNPAVESDYKMYTMSLHLPSKMGQPKNVSPQAAALSCYRLIITIAMPSHRSISCRCNAYSTATQDMLKC